MHTELEGYRATVYVCVCEEYVTHMLNDMFSTLTQSRIQNDTHSECVCVCFLVLVMLVFHRRALGTHSKRFCLLTIISVYIAYIFKAKCVTVFMNISNAVHPIHPRPFVCATLRVPVHSKSRRTAEIEALIFLFRCIFAIQSTYNFSPYNNIMNTSTCIKHDM